MAQSDFQSPITNQIASGERRQWEPPTLSKIGTVGEILKQGGGKVSAVTGDPGEPRKVRTQG